MTSSKNNFQNHSKFKNTHIVFTMEQDMKYCSHCRTTKEKSHFRVSDEIVKKTCNKCRGYYATSENKKHKTLPDELSKIELKQQIKSIVWNDDNDDEVQEKR